jgi:hypothetical protein
MLRKTMIVLAAAAALAGGVSADAFAAGGHGGGGGGGHAGAFGGGHMGGGMAGSHFGGVGESHFGGAMSGGNFGGRAERQRYGHYRGWGAPYGYYGDNGYYDPSTVAPDEQPSYPAAAYPYVKPPRSSCSTQTYKVPSEGGGEASVNVVRC